MVINTTPQISTLPAPPFSIGNVVVDPPVILAPMADVTNGPFRRVCKRIGAPGLIVTEQISTMALHYNSERTWKMFDWMPEEMPLSVQLFGSDPVVMAEAAKIVADRGAAIVDINMGCWVPKVCKTGAGAALLKDAATAVKVVEAVVKAVNVPVTVKMRAGWSCANLTSVPLAIEFEKLGVSAFALHGRTAEQGYTGSADWKWIRNIKDAVTVPVTGNGDIKTPFDARAMMDETGCDGVMIGRAAIGNPWILRDTSTYLITGIIPDAPSLLERVEAAMDHLISLANIYGEDRAVRHLRGQIPMYIKGYRGANEAREKIVRAVTVKEVEIILSGIEEKSGYYSEYLDNSYHSKRNDSEPAVVNQ